MMDLELLLMLKENHENAVKLGFKKMELTTDNVGELLDLALNSFEDDDLMSFMDEAMENWNEHTSEHKD